MAKRAVNTMIGIMSIDHNMMYTHRCSPRHDYQGEAGMVTQITAGDIELWDFVSATRMLSYVSYIPIHDMCLSFEHTSVGKALFVLKASRQILYELRTDAVLYQPVKRNTIQLDEIQFQDLHLLRQQYNDVPGVRKLDQRIDIATILSEQPVCWTHAATEPYFFELCHQCASPGLQGGAQCGEEV